MLSQEFPLPEVLRIWDSLLADVTRSDLLIDVCTAMLTLVREEILKNEFPENMKLLQVMTLASIRVNHLCIYKNINFIF
jgi:hypothetical protein